MIRYNEIILSHIERRIKRNANALILVVGDVGSGKTYFCLDFATALSKKFSCSFDQSWVSFGAKQVFEAVMREHSPGQPILSDEFGVAMSARNSFSKENRAISFLLQTCRFKNHVLLFTVPKSSFVDVHARKLFHYQVEVKPRFKNNKNRVSFSELKEIESWKGRYKRSFLIKNPIMFKDRETDEIKSVPYYESSIPDKKLIDDYEKKRDEFISGLYDQQSQNLGIEKKREETPELVTKICGLCGRLQDIDPTDLDYRCRCGARLL